MSTSGYLQRILIIADRTLYDNTLVLAPGDNALSKHCSHSHLPWYYSQPFVRPWLIGKDCIDHYQHTNNVAYLSRAEKLSWQHSNALGLSFTNYQRLNTAMVITQHELKYHQSTHLGDQLACATWIVACDQKLRLTRQFQFINTSTHKTCFSATTHFVCVDLGSGRPKRMPSSFVDIYSQALCNESPRDGTS